MRRSDAAMLAACLAVAGCGVLPPPPPDRPMFRDPALTPQAAAGRLVSGRSTRSDVAALLGDADRLAFDSGYEVWVYRSRPARDDEPELVVLFAPDGSVKKIRLRAGTR